MLFGNNMKVTKRSIYVDYAATTPVDDRVARVMRKYLSDEFGNPSSVHSYGVRAKKAVEDSRKKVAGVLKCRPQEVYFTGGGTEGDNLAIFGIAKAYRNSIRDKYEYKDGRKYGHIITSAIEHHAVLSPCHILEREGFDVTYLPVSKDGLVDPKNIKRALRPDTFLVSIMYANNEIGTVQPISEIAKVIRHYRRTQPSTLNARPYFHTDACQAPGALSLNVAKLGVDLMTISGSKIYGPKGVGALYIKEGVEIESLVYGGGQERGIRSGTENVAGIVGLAEALIISEEMREKESKRLVDLRNYFAESITKKFPEVEINGSMKERLPNNLNIYIPNIENEQLVIELDAIGVAVSAGSACHSNGSGGSHVIWAISNDSKRINGSVRFTFGRTTTKKDIDFVLKSLPEILNRIKV